VGCVWGGREHIGKGELPRDVVGAALANRCDCVLAWRSSDPLLCPSRCHGTCHKGVVSRVQRCVEWWGAVVILVMSAGLYVRSVVSRDNHTIRAPEQ
jgi:hypothetical protein